MVKNDWIVAGLNNPEFTAYDFSTIADMNLNNTQMLSADEYLKSDFIKNHEMFQDDSGNFSEKKFKQYHQQRLEDFREFQEQEFPKGPQLDMFDTDRTKNSRVKDIRLELGRHVNPDRQAVGIEGVRVWSDPTQTKSEIAQSQKIWDTEKQEFKDFSSNDKALSNGLFDWLGQVFSDPLVMATWEEDGEHIDPITGMTRVHKKGDYKLNDKGTYYYETLGNRSPIGKEVLSVFDTLTVDGEGINKYDFFDSDDVEKSVAGVIAKNVAIMLPMFFTGSWAGVATAYSSALIAKEFAKAMPMLYGMATVLSDSNEAPTWINKVAAFGTKFSGGTSQYAKENTFSFENFGNLIADVALQWGQQKTIANAINKLRGSNTYIDDAVKSAKSLYETKAKTLGHSEELWQVCQNKFIPEAQKIATAAGQLGRDASLAYMAIISNSDVYNDMRERGLTNTEAAAVAFGSTLGMFAFDKYTGLGEIFFDDATDDAVKLARKSIKDELGSASEMFKGIKNSTDSQTNKYLKLIHTAAEKANGVISKFSDDLKYHTLNFTGKAIGEGLEEVSEELITDVSKSIYELAGQLGADTTLKDVGAWDNAVERYTMSFLGGAIGGGIFYGKEAIFDGKSYKQDSKNWEMATLIRNGHVSELRDEVMKLKKSGKLGNTKLSASKYDLDSKGERVWLTTENIAESQNDAIANAMLEKITALETIINNNKVNLTDDQLFDNMVFAEKRYKKYQEIAPLTNYYQDFNDVVNKLIAAELNLKAASNTIEGKPDGTPRTDKKLTAEQETARTENLKQLQEEVDLLRKQKDDFLSGDTSLDYTRKLNFLIDPMLHEQFLSIDKNQFFKEKYGNRKYNELTEEEQQQFDKDWQEKVKSTLSIKANIDQSWQRYKEIEALISPELEQIAQQIPEFRKLEDQSYELILALSSRDDLKQSYITYDTKLDGETDEDFEFRKTKKIFKKETLDSEGNAIEIDQEESDPEFLSRISKRKQQVDLVNRQKTQDWVDKVQSILASTNYKVDPATYRMLRRMLPYSQKEIISDEIKSPSINADLKPVLQYLKTDLSNVDEIQKDIQQLVTGICNKIMQPELARVASLKVEDDTGQVKSLADLVTDLEASGESTHVPIKDFAYLWEDDEEVSEVLSVFDDSTTLYDLVALGIGKPSQTLIDEYQALYDNQFNTMLSNVKNDPIYQLVDSLKTDVKNPIGELIRTLSEKNGDTIPNLDLILDKIQTEYDSLEDIHELVLDDSQMSDLVKVRDYLKLIKGFMYAAASSPNVINPVGHNQIINAFAKNNKQLLTKDWEVLPEIDSDYYLVYSNTLDRYAQEIDYWIQFSQDNNVNKIRKFVAVDKAFNKALFDMGTSKKLKFKVDDNEFDLFDGFVKSADDPEVDLFNAEQVLYNNFQKALKQSSLSVTEFLEKSNLLTALIPSLTNIGAQKMAKLSDTMKSTDLTDYDLLQYFALVFTSNPSDFYSDLKSRVEQNEKVAPITAQEYSSKLAKASAKAQFKEFIKFGYERSNIELPLLVNTTVLPGVAGAGKTDVVLRSIHDNSADVIIAGPTESQAETLAQKLNRDKSYTFRSLFTQILGESQLNEIEAELNSIDNGGGKINKHDGKYFTIKAVNNAPVVVLKKDALTFNDTLKPKQIFVDEATHLSSAHIQILDAFADSVGGHSYLAGDPNQRGYLGKKSMIEHLQEDQFFCIRAPKLTVSLRDNNLQKYINQENVRTLLDTVNNNILNMSVDELKDYWPVAKVALSKFNFQVYNHEELNGDLITTSLEPELLEKLKKGSLGFVGSESSPYLQKLKEAGLKPTILSMDQMQGREYDYVVIDHQWREPEPGMDTKEFLTTLYTAMTRATTASVFIDNGLSSIIGKNVITHNKAKAPSIQEGVEELRKRKLELISKFKLTPSEASEASEADEKSDKNFEKDFKDPDVVNPDKEVIKVVEEIAQQDAQDLDETLPQDFTPSGEQLIETFTDVTILGATVSEPQERTVKYRGKDVKVVVPVWTITPPEANQPLRNLQAFYDELKELIHYSDKVEAQQLLFQLKSGVMFNHAHEDLPNTIKEVISRKAWENKTFEIEIRKPSESDTTHLNAKYSEPGIEFGPENNRRRYIVNIVCNVELSPGKVAKFDISGLPSLNALFDHKDGIKAKLEARIKKATGEEKSKLQSQLANIDISFANYENLLSSWIDQFDKAGEFSLKINEGVLHYNKTTWLQTLKPSGKTKRIQLGGKLNPITGQSVYDSVQQKSITQIERARDTLQLRHPELVFSPIYTYASNDHVFTEISPSLKGRKSVVFVTSDALLNGKDLLNEYIKQKQGSDHHTAKIRMIVLDNYGMTFSQFIDDDFVDRFKHNKTEYKPLRQNYNGIRMFTALWNWRAGLMKFNQALNKWMEDRHYGSNTVEVLTKIDQLRYDIANTPDANAKASLEAEVSQLLQQHGLTEKDIQALEEFNTKGLADVPIFRLGYSKNGSGFYVRGNVDVSQSSLYNKDKVNLLAITPAKAKQFESLVNRVLSTVEYNSKWDAMTLGAKLMRPDNKTPWGKDELIDLEDATHRRTLSGLLSDQNGKFILQSNDMAVAYPADASWSLIPALISNLVKTITYAQNHPNDPEVPKFAKLIVPDPKDKTKKVMYPTQIDDLFSDGILKTGNDSSLFDMLDLVFHGTVADIHHVRQSGEQLLQIEDAYFKQGFFINPDVARVPSKDGGYEIKGRYDKDGKALFYEIATTSELFTVDTDIRTAGIGLRIDKLFEGITEQAQKERDTVEISQTTFQDKYPELCDIIDSVNEVLPIDEDPFAYSLDEVDEIAQRYNALLKTSVEALLNSRDRNVLQSPAKVIINDGDVQVYTVQNLIEAKLGTNAFTLEIDPNLGILVKEGKTYYSIDSNINLTIKSDDISVVTTDDSEKPQQSNITKYDTKMSNGEVFKKAFVKLLSDDDIKEAIKAYADDFGQVVGDEDIEELNNILDALFNSDIDEETLKGKLLDLTNNNFAYESFLGTLEDMAKTDEKYKEFNQIINEC